MDYRAGAAMMYAPILPPCPQCGSKECGTFACRMSGIPHLEVKATRTHHDDNDRAPFKSGPTPDLYTFGGKIHRPGR